jgi:hypothetical protein
MAPSSPKLPTPTGPKYDGRKLVDPVTGEPVSLTGLFIDGLLGKPIPKPRRASRPTTATSQEDKGDMEEDGGEIVEGTSSAPSTPVPSTPKSKSTTPKPASPKPTHKRAASTPKLQPLTPNKRPSTSPPKVPALLAYSAGRMPSKSKTKAKSVERLDGQERTKSLDLGNPLGPYDNNTVRDRVRKWQSSGGGVVQGDPMVFPPQVTPPVSHVGTLKGTELGTREPLSERRRPKERESSRISRSPEKFSSSPTKSSLSQEWTEIDDDEVEDDELGHMRERNNRSGSRGLDGDVRKATSPPKRVVSDEHWKKRRERDRLPPASPAVPGALDPARTRIASKTPPVSDDGIRVRPIQNSSDRRREDRERERSPNPESAGRRRSKPERSHTPENTGRRSKAEKSATPPSSPAERAATPKSTPTLDGDGIRVRPIRRKSNQRHRRTESGPQSEPRSKASLDSDGIRVYSTPTRRNRSPDLKAQRSEGDLRAASLYSDSYSETESDSVETSSRTTPTPPKGGRKRGSRKARKTRIVSPPNEDSLSSKRKSRTPEEETRPKLAKTPSKLKTSVLPKVGLLKKVYDELRSSKEKPAEELPKKTDRMSSWLHDTGDPFVEKPPDPNVRLPDDETGSVISSVASSTVSSQYRSKIRKEAVLPDDSISVIASRRRHIPYSEQRKVSYERAQREKSVPEPEKSSADANYSFRAEDAKPVLREDERTFISESTEKDIPRDIVADAPALSPANLRRSNRRGPPSPPRSRRSSPLKESFTNDDAATNSSYTASSFTASSEGSASTITARSPEATRRGFGKKPLSTIQSVDTFESGSGVTRSDSITTKASDETLPTRPTTAQTRRKTSGSSVTRGGHKTSLKRRLTTHSDLMSVLSVPMADNSDSKSIVSARSIRTTRSRLSTATIGDLLKELSMDEAKYLRELQTLVDGVIPVLLTCVISKSDSAVAAGLFGSLAVANDPTFTKPIVDMGISLERLKTLHKRIPLTSPDALLKWADGAQRVYADYLKAWRLGFQDLVVHLAPATAEATAAAKKAAEERSLYEGLSTVNEDGDVVNGDGERVDVAFLLKRPLVRLKYLHKTLSGINRITPSTAAENMSSRFQTLVTDARKRANEERARLEDESAAAVDPTRARDPRTLAPSADVNVNFTRRVKARDVFDLELHHSSGQRMDCTVELLLRDDAPGKGNSGDVMICEVDDTGRWLLFPPVELGRMSARNGDTKGEVVAMIRDFHSSGQEWHELFSLKTDDEQLALDWVTMLGVTPIPPKIDRTGSFTAKKEKRQQALVVTESPKSRTPSPREIEIPIGEQARGTNAQQYMPSPKTFLLKPAEEGLFSRLQGGSIITPSRNSASAMRADKQGDHSPTTQSRREGGSMQRVQSESNGSPLQKVSSLPRDLDEAMSLAGGDSAATLRRAKAKRYKNRGQEGYSGSPTSDGASAISKSDASPGRGLPFSSRHAVPLHKGEEITITIPPSEPSILSESPTTPAPRNVSPPDGFQPRPRRTSALPAMDIPVIPKTRRNSSPLSSPTSEITDPMDAPPPPPPHRTPSAKVMDAPVLSPTSTKDKRRSSSPLKHEYQPSERSYTSESYSESDVSDTDSSVSESDSDEELNGPTPLLPIATLPTITEVDSVISGSQVTDSDITVSQFTGSQASLYSQPNATLSPPHSRSPSLKVQFKSIASLHYWNENQYTRIEPDILSIEVMDGQVEAHEMSAAHSSSRPSSADSTPDTAARRAIVVLALTPVVLLRRGTGLDIWVGSPPTPAGVFHSNGTKGIMFRCRSAEECEALYSAMLVSRQHNATYNALARAAESSGNGLQGMMDSQGSVTTGRSWSIFRSNRSSYRSSRVSPTPGSVSNSDNNSVGSLASAFSALRRFGGSKKFNLDKSTLSSRGTRSLTSFSSSDNSSGLDGTRTPPDPSQLGGLRNTEIRLYLRESSKKWTDLGIANLVIQLPPANYKNRNPAVRPEELKRITVTAKHGGDLVDVVLGESCFERVARTGIAVSIWIESVGPNGEIGQVGAVGGVGGRTRVYMIQVSLCFPTLKLMWSAQMLTRCSSNLIGMRHTSFLLLASIGIDRSRAIRG